MRVFTIGTAPNIAGGSAGATVIINVSKLSGDGVTPGLPTNYYVHMTPNQPNVFASISNKTSTGFTITLTPLSTYQIIAGTVDYIVADSGSPIG
jgi:hypothetical protein